MEGQIALTDESLDYYGMAAQQTPAPVVRRIPGAQRNDGNGAGLHNSCGDVEDQHPQMVERFGMGRKITVAAGDAAVDPQFLHVGEWVKSVRFDGKGTGSASRDTKPCAHPESRRTGRRARGRCRFAL